MKYIVKWVDHKGEERVTGLLGRTGMILATDYFLNEESIDADSVSVTEVSETESWTLQ